SALTITMQTGHLASITEYGKFLAQAPVCIVIVSADTKYYLEDGCAAAENILLAAAGLGLGSCWVAGDKKPYAEEILRWLQAPDGFKLVAMLAIGHAASPMVPREKRALDKILHWQTY
ncbi:MAG TPA: nitroreductase family protein, partial [bacterium]|nr:nitroreductase family protein [bacterium]